MRAETARRCSYCARELLPGQPTTQYVPRPPVIASRVHIELHDECVVKATEAPAVKGGDREHAAP
ncbi:hypothetical protein V2W30_22755 [Streptomyces sp. Q6]|uniref:Uncharacterized protein n=1 Tax=Streptomyces citrinus TaxID=3118173 RepID=A0ACD5AFJ4_9ACTN